MAASAQKTDIAPWQFALLFASLGLVAAFAPRGMSFMPLLAWAWLVAATPRAQRSWRYRLDMPKLDSPLLPLCLLALLAVLSAAWANHPLEVLEKILLLLLILASAWLLVGYSRILGPAAFRPGGPQPRLFVLCCLASYLLLLLESLLDGWLYRHVWLAMFPSAAPANPLSPDHYRAHYNTLLNLGFMSYAMLAFPAAMLLRSRLLSGLLLGGMCVSAVLLSSNQSAMVGLLLGAGVVLLLPRLAARMQRGAVWSLLFGITLLPFFLSLVQPPEIVHSLDDAFASLYLAPRFSVYDAVITDILARPWLGHGFHASRIDAVFAYAHPHNYALQAWLELGIVGLLLLVWLLGSILRKIETLDPKWRYCALGAFFSALCGAAFSYNIWRSWWIGTLCILVWLFVVFAPRTIAQRDVSPTPHP